MGKSEMRAEGLDQRERARSELLAAVVDRSLEALDQALRNGDFEPGSAELSQALMTAVSHTSRGSYGEMMGMVKRLLDAGADPSRSSAALGGAVASDRPAGARAAFLKAPLSASALSPLHFAISRADAGLAERMIPRCSSLEVASGREGLSALGRACRRGSAGIAKALLAAGADANAQSLTGLRPLNYALAAVEISLAPADLIEALLEGGADPILAAEEESGKFLRSTNPRAQAILERWELNNRAGIRRAPPSAGSLSL